MFQPKQRVGEYVLDERVGQNAYAEEWRAHHHMWSDQEALVKIPTDPQYVANLRQEGIRIQRLVHPNIIRPIGFDPTAEPPYLITEYLRGESLRTRMSRKRLTIPQSVNILRHVLAALQFGHERQVVHGDIRPENILLESSGEAGDFAAAESVKVTDFGIGLAAAATVTRDAAAKAQAQSGSLAYVAPEQRDGAPPDVKSDIFAVGVVLFEMLTGERPSGAELPSEINPDVPAWLDDIFKKSYARRERRFDSAKAFLDATASQRTTAAPAPAAPPEPPEPNAMRIRPDTDAGPGPGTVSLPPRLVSRGSEIRLAVEDDSPPPPQPVSQEASPQEIEDVIPLGRDEDDPVPVADDETAAADEDDQKEEQQEAGAETAVTAEEQTGGEPVLPVLPRVPSPADRNALFDELAKKQVRTPDDLRAALKGYFEMRDLDQGESANIRLRLMKWAHALAGGKTDMDDQILLINAAARPLYVVKYLLRSTRGDEPIRTAAIEHPIGAHAGTALRAGDYRLVAHFSADALNEKLLESIASTPLRTVVINMTREAKREFFGRIQRQDLMIFRANVITASYRFDQKKYRAFMVGNALSVVSAGEPFTKIRQEPTKRAATLLNGEQIFQGMKELRRGLDDPQWEAKANVILSALRGKLAAAYLVEAKADLGNFAWLESLQHSAKAGRLAPGNEDALAHAANVRKRLEMLQLLPGTLIALVLIGLSVLWTIQRPDRQPGVQPLLAMLFQSSLFVAGVAAWIATLWSKAVLKSRMSRTDFAFYQAAIFPLLIALAIAFVRFNNVTSDIICGGLLAIVIVGDVLTFKKLRKHLLRPVDDSGLIGDGMTVLSRIESMLGEDWELLRPHYLELGPLYSYTSVQSAGGSISDLFSHGESSGSSDDTIGGSGSGTWTTSTVSSDDPATGNPDVDKMVQQMNGRISANLRALAPVARNLLSIFNEYAKSVSARQVGMMQTNAGKIEQKGKDLAAKLDDFDRLCRTPLTLDSGQNSDQVQEATARLAERSEDPDIVLLKSLANRAKAFREDQANAAADITAIVPEVEAAIERMKKG